jgi:F-type H+-transporting ATPase subunit b
MNRLFAIISASFVSFMPLIAWAQETVPEATLEHSIDKTVRQEELHHAHSGGLPQFNPATWPSQIFWLAISFVILYFFFSKFTLPSLTGTIEGRAQKIANDIKTAENLSAQAEKIRLGYESDLKKAAAQSSSDMKQIDEEAKAKLAASLAAFRTRYEGEMAAVEKRLDASKATAMADMQKVAADIATQAAEKIAGIKADSTQAESIVNSLKNRAA